MAKVQVQVAGGSIQQKDVGTVGELAKTVGAIGYQATVNGEPMNENYELQDFEFVSFAKPVKAGNMKYYPWGHERNSGGFWARM